jgi:NAD(P)-dependent dehydrogenase (short-subunit alcohol dehydrogenase family)
MKIGKGTQVFITGAASGIGRATAIAMARLGARLFITDINRPGLEGTTALIRKEGGEVAGARAFDISDYSAVKTFADEVHAKFRHMDVIVNNAGIALFALIENMTHAHWEKVIRVNLWGPIHGMECFLPEMIKAKKGHLVNVSSAAGLTGAPWHAAYAATKWGLLGISEALRYDLMQHHIGVTVICPGAVETNLKHTVEILGVDLNTPAVVEMKQRFSGRAVTPERVAELIIGAIQKNKFLVITSWDIRALYFFKKHFSPLYHYILLRISRMMNAMMYPQERP